MAEFGAITEQGDLGLGFDLLNNKDNKTVNEAMNKEQQQQTNSQPQVINENETEENK